jgi:hypothetical protein
LKLKVINQKKKGGFLKYSSTPRSGTRKFPDFSIFFAINAYFAASPFREGSYKREKKKIKEIKVIRK